MSLASKRHADRWGDRTAIVDGDERVSYAELAARVETAAGRLTALEVGHGDRVALVSRNRVEVLVFLFAVHRVGGVFAPVSHHLTPATVSEPMAQIDPDLVLFESAQRDLVRQFDARSFEEFDRVTPSDVQSVEWDGSRKDELDTALLVHTEDGTRVVSLSNRAVEWNCRAATAGWGLGRNDCTLTVRPLSLPDCLLGFALPLLTVGGRVVLRRAFDPADALFAIESHGVTCMEGGPTEFRELVDEGSLTNRSSLDWAATRGHVPPDVREAFPVPLLRVYGHPETGPNVLRESSGSKGTLYPFPSYAVRIGDGAKTDEEIGELFVSGPATASGSLDGEAFGEWVPTGDVFRRGPKDSEGSNESNGYVLVADDEAIESGAEPIHPWAVETVLESHPDVRAAGIVETVAETGGIAPKALVVGDVSPGELREFAEERLAAHEVPRSIESVPSLPRHSSGELDRGELRRRFGTWNSEGG
ncbi:MULTISPECIES: AMP-binding protein [unclassified Haladaptatus]|uniref:class I adenylate-forming enzyme family protein n=1 Tax=unclassified Haladaptatus TaxID=2622732 RepID=UPI00209C656E|nr:MULTISPECIES: AMP-binding protein [unclassified Haladaptatus]MCO8242740.1 AMP-binding protein [Haladaptatus sp. AB643]MCO8252499.1 AMP-binding protein [Haladaptatus sp. AB618]